LPANSVEKPPIAIATLQKSVENSLDCITVMAIFRSQHPQGGSDMVLDFNSLYTFPGRFERLFEDFFKPQYAEGRRVAYPPLNVSEDQTAYYVRSELPGLPLEGIELTLTEKSLVIKGERPTEQGKYYRQERPAGFFQRVVALNVPVDRDAVRATLADGVLTVILPKCAECIPRKINIDVA
jgi:HSP20 family protein